MLTHDFSTCPRCGCQTEKAKAFNGGESEFWYKCSKCNTYINSYIPQEHQASVHQDAHRFTGNFGGYGSGKTLTSREEFYKHMFLTPLGNTLVGANVQSQYEQTMKRDIENDLPEAFFSEWSAQKQYYNFLNGHRLMFRPFDDPDKLRSYNLSMFIIMEASEVNSEAFTQLKTRLRNAAAGIPEYTSAGKVKTRRTKTGVTIPIMKADWRKGIVESNPDSGWIRDDLLDKSDQIYKHGDIPDTYTILEVDRDPSISAHITATSANEFLPANFIEDNCKNKPAWWINRYINGSFLYAEGLVYPSALKAVEDDFDIPADWPRLCAYDYGLSDDSVFLFGAVDMRNGILHIYKEVRVNDKSVQDLARLFYQNSKDIPVGGWICPPIIDPKSAPKRDYEKKSLADHFLEYGISFIPGQVSVDARIMRLNTYFESGRVKIMKTCLGLIRELKGYKFKPKTLSNDRFDDKPEDKNNHAINPLEWIVMELPANPKNIITGIYDRRGRDLTVVDHGIEDRERTYAAMIFNEPEPEETSYFDYGG